MRDPKVDGTKVVCGPCRLSYVHLINPEQVCGQGEPKFTVSVLIPKTETKTIAAINKALETAKENGKQKVWGGTIPNKLDIPLRDGDIDKEGDENYAGQYYVSAKSLRRPGIIDKNKEPLTSEDDVYSGMWGLVSITLFPYDKAGKKGVGVGLNNVMKTKDDERFGGGASAETDFADYTDDDDDM